jgi:PAS domain S-box-containing protein
MPRCSMRTDKLADVLTSPMPGVAADMPLAQGLANMRQRDAVALAVLDQQGRPLGVISARDLLAAACRQEAEEAALKLFMSEPPLILPATQELLAAYWQMRASKARYLLAVDAEGRYVGLATEGDFIRHPAIRQRLRGQNVVSVMARIAATLSADASVGEAIDVLLKHGADGVLVQQDGEPIGLFNEQDWLRLSAPTQSAMWSHALGSVVTQTLPTIAHTAMLPEAIERMERRQRRCLIVSDSDGKAIGLLGEHAIAHAVPSDVPASVRARPLGGRMRAWVFSLLAAALVFGTEQTIEYFAHQSGLEEENNQVLQRLSALRARLEGVLNANLFLLRGLAAVISAQRQIGQAEFSAIARHLVDERHALRTIGVAPDMVISLVYPLEGNTAALGLDYRRHPQQRAAALRARDSGQAVVAGPLTLQQGGVAFVLREPVFIPAMPADGAARFWGLISAVIDASTLYRLAGLEDPELRLALRGSDGDGAAGAVFFGDASLFDKRSVRLAVTLPGGSWQLAAIPAGGWGQPGRVIYLIRLMGVLAALAAALMTLHLVRGTQALASHSARLRALLHTIPDLVWLKDPDGRYLACNPRFEQFFGAREADIIGRTDHDFVPAELADFFRAKDRAAIAAGGASVNEEWVSFANDGHRELLETIKAPVQDAAGRLLGVLGVARDITGRKQAEQHVRRLNRLLGMLSGINEAIVRLRDPAALFQEACRIAVEIGGFRMAWLGMLDGDSCEVRPSAHAGTVKGYLENLRISLVDDERARGPTGTALRAGRHVVCNSIATDPRMLPWRESALALGYQSSASFPIWVGGKVCGAFNLYAGTAEFFDAEELRLLDELAEDIGFALDFIEANRGREVLNQRMLDLLESMSDGFISLDRDWCYRYVNRKAGELMGDSAADLIGKHFWSGFSGSVSKTLQTAFHKAMDEGLMTHFDNYDATAGRWFENRIYPTQDGLSVFFTDITGRKMREQELKRLHTTLQALIEGSTDAICVKDLDGRYIVVNRTMAEQLGYPVEQIIGVDDAQLFTAELAERRRADDQRIMAAALTETYEEPFVSGAETYQHLTTKGPLLVDGEVRGVFRISRDISQRKAAEVELRRQKDLLDHTGRLAHVGGWQIDLTTMRCTLTDEMARIHGLQPGPQIGNADILASLDTADRVRLEQAQQAAMTQAQPYELELCLSHAEGERRWVHAVGLPVLEAGRVVRLEGASQDITKRKLAEAQVRQGNMVLDSVFQALPDLFFLMDADGVIRDYRACQAENLYAPPSAFIGKRMQEVLPAPVGCLFEANVARMRQQGGMATYEYELPMPAGVGYFEARLSALPNSSQFITVVRDITERKAAEALLEKRRQLLADSQRIAHIGSWEIELPSGAYTWTQETYRIYGVSPDTFQPDQQAFLALVHADDRRAVAQSEAAIHAGETPRDTQFRIIRPDGDERIISGHGVLVRDAEGQPMRLVGTVQDITERKRMEDDIRQLNAHLEQRVRQRTAELAAANKELETFTYSVSHDLKAPLRGIDGYSRLLLEDHQQQLDEEGRLFVNNVRSGVAQMGQLIDDLLAYSRMERRSLHSQHLDLERQVTQILDEREADITARGMQVTLALQGLSGRADAEGLAMVLRNLIDNALKFTRDSQPPRLSLSSVPSKGSIILKISDNGIGFDMRFHDRVFEIFQRLQRAEDYAGTGIGLAIVHKAMQRMGGRVWAESAPGQGATFYLELPR